MAQPGLEPEPLAYEASVVTLPLPRNGGGRPKTPADYC